MGSRAHCERFRVETRCTRLRVGVAKAALEPAHGAHVECALEDWVSVRVNPVSWSVVVRSRSFSSTVC